MKGHPWLRPPQNVLAIFVVVGIVSAAALMWLMSSLLNAERAAETQRQRERLGQAADRTIAEMQSALTELELQLNRPLEAITNIHNDVDIIQLGPMGIRPKPGDELLYYPEPFRGPEASEDIFESAEFEEEKDLRGAADRYARLAEDRNKAVRAGALMRLARVLRRMNNTQGSLGAYDELSKLSGVSVADLPVELVARVGRASVFADLGQTHQLRAEADALSRDLNSGRWQLSNTEYDSYSLQAAEWLGTTATEVDPDRIARAEVAAWLWQNRRSMPSRQLKNIEDSTFLIMTRATPDGLNAAIAGADYLRSLCRPNIENISLDCSLSDADGGVIAGGGIVPGITEVRTIAMTRLPWTIQLSASPFPGPSAKKPTLMAIAVVLILVWVTGAVFIARVIRREIRVNRLQSDFVAAVSHEFRSPLTSISQISEMLSSGRWTNDDARRQSYDMLGLEADRLRRLVESLLDFQKFESESAVYQFESVELGSFLYAVVSDFQAHVANRGYRIEVKNAGADLHVRADRDALALAVWNLLDNAVKYSPDCRTVWVDLEHVGNNIIVAVRDRGLGIPAKEQRAIFEKFVRGAESKARRIKGTGIGLALVRRIVQAHGGEIRVSSQPGDGSRFAVVLPEGAGS